MAWNVSDVADKFVRYFDVFLFFARYIVIVHVEGTAIR